MRSDTWGSETSQYPEEKKSTEIPQVVASERGGGQTRGPSGFLGYGPASRSGKFSRTAWEGRPQRVRDP